MSEKSNETEFVKKLTRCITKEMRQTSDFDVDELNLRVWWIPRMPLTDENIPFYKEVSSPLDGKKMLDALDEYDQYQFEHDIKTNCVNAGGMEEFDDGCWAEWVNVFGDYINDLSIEDLE